MSTPSSKEPVTLVEAMPHTRSVIVPLAVLIVLVISICVQPMGSVQVKVPAAVGVPENLTIIEPDKLASPVPGTGLTSLSQPGTVSRPATTVTPHAKFVSWHLLILQGP